MATYSIILVGKILCREEPGWLQSMRLQRVGHSARMSTTQQLCFSTLASLSIGIFLWILHIAQSCPTFCNIMDYTVHGILQARILEWVAVPISKGSSQPRDWTQVSRIAGGFFTNWAMREAIAWEMSAIVQWFEHSLVLSFLGIRLEIDFFSVLWPLLSFPNVLTYWV